MPNSERTSKATNALKHAQQNETEAFRRWLLAKSELTEAMTKFYEQINEDNAEVNLENLTYQKI